MSGISEFFANNDVGGYVSGLGQAAGAWINTVAPGVGTLVSGAASGIGGALSANYERQQQIQAEQRAEQRAIDAENRQEQNQIEAEQRANAEYDRRMADERAYNDPTAQAERLRAAGINPMANLGQGVTSSSTKMSAPSQSSSNMAFPNGAQGPQSRGVPQLSLGDALQAQSLAEDIRGKKLDNDRKQIYLEAEQDFYWLGQQADYQNTLTEAQEKNDRARYYRALADWEEMSADDRIAVFKSEAYRNNTQAKLDNLSIEEKTEINAQLSKWVHLLPEMKQAELNKQLAEAEAISDKSKRENAKFWIMLGACVAGGVCMCVPGTQGLGVALVATGASGLGASGGFGNMK